MTATPDSTPAPARAASYLDTIAVYLRPRVLIVMFLGFSAGLPLALIGLDVAGLERAEPASISAPSASSRWSARPTRSSSCGRRSSTPSTCRSCRALLGRRRGWLVFSQLLLMAAIVFLAFCDPAISPWHVAFGALLVATASATQDIVIDAFRVESLDKNEQAAGMASYVAAYRIGMLVSTAGVLYLVAAFEDCSASPRPPPGRSGYLAMAVLVVIGIVTTIVATEPAAIGDRRGRARRRRSNSVMRVAQAAYRAFADFLTRDAAIVVLRVRRALQILRRLRRHDDGAVRDQDRLLVATTTPPSSRASASPPP